MQKVVWTLVVLLVVLHQDVWFWEDERLVFGFLPVGLAWHMGISVGASLTWLLATRHCWPAEADSPDPAHLAATKTAKGGAA